MPIRDYEQVTRIHWLNIHEGRAKIVFMKQTDLELSGYELADDTVGVVCHIRGIVPFGISDFRSQTQMEIDFAFNDLSLHLRSEI